MNARTKACDNIKYSHSPEGIIRNILKCINLIYKYAAENEFVIYVLLHGQIFELKKRKFGNMKKRCFI